MKQLKMSPSVGRSLTKHALQWMESPPMTPENVAR